MSFSYSECSDPESISAFFDALTRSKLYSLFAYCFVLLHNKLSVDFGVQLPELYFKICSIFGS